VTLRRRLIALSAAAVAVSIVLASVVAYLVVRGELRAQVDASLREQAGGAVTFALPAPRAGERGARDRVILAGPDAERAGGPASPPLEAERPPPGARREQVRVRLPPVPFGGAPGYAQIVDPRGRVSFAGDGPARLPVDERTREVARGEREPFLEDHDVAGTHLRVLTTSLVEGEALQVARPLEEVDDSLRTLALVLAGVSLGGVALAAALGFGVARAALRPVERLTRAAEHVTRTRDLSRRIDADDRDEIGRLARTFNTMLAALESSLGAQRQLVADASHELRTPLTSLRTNVEVLGRSDALDPAERERLIEDVRAQLEELSALVADLVDLAREEEPAFAREAVRLDELVAGCVERALRHAPDREFDCDLAPAVVDCVPERVARAVANLLDNAAKWSPPGGRIEVRLTLDGELSVRDHGPGIADEDLPHVFDRFYRARSARGRPGSGLGLAIVRQVAEAHGGRVRAESLRSEGGGARLTLTL
jgi:two-component system, OmpR family, sensor histidine kinase MprB